MQCCESIEASQLQSCNLGDLTGLLGGAGSGVSGDVGRLQKRLQVIGGRPGPLLPPGSDPDFATGSGGLGAYPPESCAWQRGNLQIGTPSSGSFLALLPGVFVANPNAGVAGQLPFLFQNTGFASGNPQPGPFQCAITQTIQNVATEYPVTTKECRASWGQACYHYASVADYQNVKYASLTCPTKQNVGNRKAPDKYNNQHNKEWFSWIKPLDAGLGYCQRDEYPFFAFIGDGNDYYQWIRFISSAQNGGAGSMARGVCNQNPPSSVDSTTQVVQGLNGLLTCIETTSTVSTRSVLYIDYANAMLSDRHGNQGLGQNPCTPYITNDVGFALFTDDAYYVRNGLVRPNYLTVPPQALIGTNAAPTPNGGFPPNAQPPPPPPFIPPPPQPQPHQPPPRAPIGPHPNVNRRRSIPEDWADTLLSSDPARWISESLVEVSKVAEAGWANDESSTLDIDFRGKKDKTEDEDETDIIKRLGLVVDEGNSTRWPTRQELRDMGFVRCRSENCADELAAVGRDVHGKVTVQHAPVAMATLAAAAADREAVGGRGRPATVTSGPSVATATEVVSASSHSFSGRGRKRRHGVGDAHVTSAPSHDAGS